MILLKILNVNAIDFSCPNRPTITRHPTVLVAKSASFYEARCLQLREAREDNGRYELSFTN